MLNWVLCINILFWCCFLCFLNSYNFFFLIILSETTWVCLYVYSSLIGSIIDDISLISLTFFILGLAAIELSIGLMLLVFFKYLNLSINLLENQGQTSRMILNKFIKLQAKKRF